ncbi:MAG: hypothetical protein PUK21_01565 [Peptostreptococcaceae bacterium]|nr:hypothetical protein [Peptostreptococcaceae bacterium]MDY5738697.1 hypothetical protein [Anaerovoracaceae bacterium]
MDNKIINKLLSFIADTLKQLKNTTPKLNFMGNVYWGTNKWICPADGFVTLDAGSTSDSVYHLLYVSDKAGHYVAALAGIGRGSSATVTFPVIKGEEYHTLTSAFCRSVNAYYYKIGGVLTKLLKLLQSLTDRKVVIASC